jgi:hypothetical protein
MNEEIFKVSHYLCGFCEWTVYHTQEISQMTPSSTQMPTSNILQPAPKDTAVNNYFLSLIRRLKNFELVVWSGENYEDGVL